jgi:ribosomal protein S18 acetylase RimI-like enzyme
VPTLEELAEHTEVHLRPRWGFENVEHAGLVYVAGRRDANVHPYRVDDVAAAVGWARDEARARGHRSVEWWVGWRAEPADLGGRLEVLGVPRSTDPPTLTGMTCDTAPPAEAAIDVRRVETLDEYLAVMEVDWAAWNVPAAERDDRRRREIERFEPMMETGSVHHFAGLLDGTPVGIGRAIDMDGAVALFGGAVLPAARGRGVYRALVRARWDHAVERGTPLLVVQAGPMSAPVLDGLGFKRHGDLALYCDTLER